MVTVIAHEMPKNTEVHEVLSHCQVRVDFRPEWFDANGLPTQLGEWIGNNLKPGFTAVGVRWLQGKALKFHLSNPSTPLDRWQASFDLYSGDCLQVYPGLVEYYSKAGDHLERRYIQYQTDNGPVWKLDFEVRKVRLNNFSEIPMYQYQALQQIDYMAYRLTGVQGRHPSTLMSMYGRGSPHADNMKRRWTTPETATVYRYVSTLYSGLQTHDHNAPPDTDKLRKLMANIRCILANQPYEYPNLGL